MNPHDSWLLMNLSGELDAIEHRAPTEEIRFYMAVVSGDMDAVQKNCEQARFLDSEGVGVLSRNPVTNFKYHFVITTAMLARLCKENGMEMEVAYRLSDFYIQKLDNIHTIEGVRNLHDEMVMDYTKKMRVMKRSSASSKHVSACKEYIFNHIRERITVEDISESLGVTPSYLSRVFKAETGTAVSAYIREQKIEQAKHLLRYSEESVAGISTLLAFSSQSHFIQQFRDVVGMTPKKFRDQNYLVAFTSSEAPDGGA